MTVKTFEQTLFDMLDDGNVNAHQIKPVVDVVNNKLYYQTAPYIENGKVKITRIAEYDIEIKKAYSVIEEYNLTTKLEESND